MPAPLLSCNQKHDKYDSNCTQNPGKRKQTYFKITGFPLHLFSFTAGALFPFFSLLSEVLGLVYQVVNFLASSKDFVADIFESKCRLVYIFLDSMLHVGCMGEMQAAQSVYLTEGPAR